MSTYFTDDFADFTSGTPPAWGDWTARIKTAVTWTPAADVAVPQASSSDWNVLSWNDVADGNHANIEVLCIANFTTLPRYFSILRGSGADESPTHYALYAGGSVLRVYYCSGADAPTQVSSVTKTHNTSTDTWFRFRVNGASPTTIQAKSWTGAIGDEPGTWDIDTTDSTGPQSAGWNGLSDYSLGGGQTIKQIGYGTNGDTAPASAGTTATSIAFRRAFPVPILNF